MKGNFFENILKYVMLNVFHLSFLKDKWDTFMQFIKFGIVGLSNTIISYVVYLIALKVNCYYIIASILGFLVSIVNAFYWNNKYVFKVSDEEVRSIWKSFCKTFISYAGTGLVLNNILLIVQVDCLHWNETIAPLINLVITIPLNFILNKLWAFRSSHSKKDVD